MLLHPDDLPPSGFLRRPETDGARAAWRLPRSSRSV